jgi:hypothetical protein
MANVGLSQRQRKQLRKDRQVAPRYPKAGEAAREVKVSSEPPAPIERDGLVWLAKKKRLSLSQLAEAMAYRNAYRDAGELSMKSCLNVGAGVGGQAGPGDIADRAVVSMTTARRELFVARYQVLRGQVDMLSVMDGVCGVGWTVRDLAAGDQVRARELEAVLKVALDLLVAHRMVDEAVEAARALKMEA